MEAPENEPAGRLDRKRVMAILSRCEDTTIVAADCLSGWQ
jgi:hypothetical protein